MDENEVNDNAENLASESNAEEDQVERPSSPKDSEFTVLEIKEEKKTDEDDLFDAEIAEPQGDVPMQDVESVQGSIQEELAEESEQPESTEVGLIEEGPVDELEQIHPTEVGIADEESQPVQSTEASVVEEGLSESQLIPAIEDEASLSMDLTIDTTIQDFELKVETDTITLRGSIMGDIRRETESLIPEDTETIYTVAEDEDGEAERYKISSRYRGEEAEHRISGDFTAVFAVPIKTGVRSKTSIESYHSEEEEEEEEEEIEEEEEEPEVMDRQPYYELYDKLMAERAVYKMKNNFLQRKMAEYFRKRKMEHVLKENEQQVDTQQKYGHRLDALAELIDLDQRKRSVINAELDELRRTRDEKLTSITQGFKQMQDREQEISTGLINTKTGKEIPEKLIERLLRRQFLASKEVGDLRLKFIKIRDRVAEKQAALQALDKLGENLRIIDYEQLKMENQSHADKIEERDEELTRLRFKCEKTIQILAHLREKSACTTIEIMDDTGRLREVEIECMEARERANFFKQERDYYRNLTSKLEQESGLLARPKLLRDMEDARADVKSSAEKLKCLQEQNEEQAQQLRAIRKHIESAPAKGQAAKKLPERTTKTKRKPTFYKGRPTLMVPVMPESAFMFQKRNFS